MKVEANNPVTGEKVTAELTSEQAAHLEGLDQDHMPEGALDAFMDSLKLSPESKAQWDRFRKITVVGGGSSIEIGKRIMEISVALQKQFPYATFGVMVGLVISIIITAIPVLGTIIGGVITPVAVALGLVIGVVFDIQDNAIYKKINDATAMFNPMKPSFKEGKQALEQLYRTLVPQA
jgi:hypothetical protein